ncbi:MAG: hypothetical protein AAGD18_01660 [Actinomycetota bacterium]
MSGLTVPDPPGALAPGLAPLYDEARAVADASPASAAALLRLVIRAVLVGHGRPGRDLRKDLDAVAGTVPSILRALDVIGLAEGHARRPGEIDLTQGHADAQNLFMFVHLLTEQLGDAGE